MVPAEPIIFEASSVGRTCLTDSVRGKRPAATRDTEARLGPGAKQVSRSKAALTWISAHLDKRQRPLKRIQQILTLSSRPTVSFYVQFDYPDRLRFSSTMTRGARSERYTPFSTFEHSSSCHLQQLSGGQALDRVRACGSSRGASRSGGFPGSRALIAPVLGETRRGLGAESLRVDFASEQGLHKASLSRTLYCVSYHNRCGMRETFEITVNEAWCLLAECAGARQAKARDA